MQFQTFNLIFFQYPKAPEVVKISNDVIRYSTKPESGIVNAACQANGITSSPITIPYLKNLTISTIPEAPLLNQEFEVQCTINLVPLIPNFNIVYLQNGTEVAQWTMGGMGIFYIVLNF